MKTKLLSVIAALFAVLSSAYSAGAITSFNMTINHNANGSQMVEFPSSGFSEVSLLNETTTSLIIEKIEATASANVTNVDFYATMYNAGSTPEADRWVTMPLNYDSKSGKWQLSLENGQGELLQDIGANKTKTFEFYLKAQCSDNTYVLYNNGGSDYKVTFTPGEAGSQTDWKVKFLNQSTAGINLKIDGSDWSTTYKGDAVRERYYGWNPGDLKTFGIDGFFLNFICNENVDISTAFLQYRVYEAGTTPTSWDGLINAELTSQTEQYDKASGTTVKRMEYVASEANRVLTTGLTSGKDYVLEMEYYVVDSNGDHIQLGERGNGNMMFTFSLSSGEVIGTSGAITSFNMTINHNANGSQNVEFPSSGFSEVSLQNETTTSLIIEKIEAAASANVTNVDFYATMYNAGSTPEADRWVTMPLNYDSKSGKWLLSLENGQGELLQDIGANKTKTFEFYLKAQCSDNTYVLYNNGGSDYKVTFTPGEAGSQTDWKVKFLNQSTAGINLKIDGSDWSTTYKGDAVRERYYGWNPGELNTFSIDGFFLNFICNENVDISTAFLQYRVYEAGTTPTSWDGLINAELTSQTEQYDKASGTTVKRMEYVASEANRVLTTGLTSGKDYVLEMEYYVVDSNGDHIQLGKRGNGNMMFTFSLSSSVVMGDVNADNQVSMSDANLVVNYYLADENEKPANFNFKAADLNNDNKITIADSNLIVNMFLEQ